MSQTREPDRGKPRLIGVNHVDLEVGDLDAARGPEHRPDAHFGLVVDDREAVRALAAAAGARILDGRFFDFLDPWGNRIEIVDYASIQFTKAEHIQRGMGVNLGKSPDATRQLVEKGMAP